MNIVEVIKPHVQNIRQSPKWRKGALIGLGVLGIALITYSLLAYRQQTSKDACSSADCISTITPGPSPSPSTSSTPTATPQKVASYLDGTPADPGSENRHPLAVMIENHPDARPQSGLSQASLVYEAIAEGGITRFMAVFANPTQAIKVGPVRSARTYFVDFATELNAFYAHVGGNMDALDQIKATGVLDLDQFALGTAAYHREPRGGIAIEHTMFSSTELLWKYATETKHWSQTGDFTPWTFQPEKPADQRPGANSITVNFSDPQYKVVWSYDPTTNTYSRNMAGRTHIDANTGSQITAKNIVLETVDRRPTVTRIGEQGWIYTLTGSGKMVMFSNGVTTTGTWKKEGTSRTRYYDASGKEVAFVPGATWVEVIHPDTPVQY